MPRLWTGHINPLKCYDRHPPHRSNYHHRPYLVAHGDRGDNSHLPMTEQKRQVDIIADILEREDKRKNPKRTPARLRYWASLRKRRANTAYAWKGNKAGVKTKHQYLARHYGRPDHCKSRSCEGRSTIFEWCLRTGRKYSHNRRDYIWLCRSCHRKYDMTPEKRERSLKNLMYVKDRYVSSR
jgi:hypothetical protein